MGRREWLALGLLGATFLAGAALASPGGQTPWMIARASGLAAFAALTLSMILGMLITTRAGEPQVPRIFNFEIHSFVSVLALTLIGVHVGSLLFDATFHFTPLTLLIPFISPYAAIWTGLGVMAAWSVAFLVGSFWAKKRIGHKTWRKLHYLSFAGWVLALVHGMSAGTDTSNALVYWFYGLSVMAVAFLFVLRIGGWRKATPATKPAAARPVAASAASLPATKVSGARRPQPVVSRAARRNDWSRNGQARRSTHNALVVAAVGGLVGAGVLGAVLGSHPNVNSAASSVSSTLSQITSARTTRGS